MFRVLCTATRTAARGAGQLERAIGPRRALPAFADAMCGACPPPLTRMDVQPQCNVAVAIRF